MDEDKGLADDAAALTVTGADLVRYDPDTDVREVVSPDLPEEDCEGLTALLREGLAELLPGTLRGWGRERTLRTEDGATYHVDLEG